MITTNEITELVSNYTQQKEKDIEAFSAQFAELFYDIEETGVPDAIQLSYKIQSKLADVSAGVESDAGFENFLWSILPSNVFVPSSLFPTGLFNTPRIQIFTQFISVVSAESAVEMASSLGSSGKGLLAECASTAYLQPVLQTSTGPVQSQQVVGA